MSPALAALPTERTRPELLTDPHLLDRIVADVARCGLVGETTNTPVGYLAAVSRKLGEPLAVLIQSGSAAGKTALMDALLAMIPTAERVTYSAVTGRRSSTSARRIWLIRSSPSPRTRVWHAPATRSSSCRARGR